MHFMLDVFGANPRRLCRIKRAAWRILPWDEWEVDKRTGDINGSAHFKPNGEDFDEFAARLAEAVSEANGSRSDCDPLVIPLSHDYDDLGVVLDDYAGLVGG